jgi:hypothetical protein
MQSACKDDSSTMDDSNPSNLNFEVVISEDRSGNIEIKATADNAVDFEFKIGESGSEIIGSTSGTVSYTYAISGLYEISVKAFGSSGRFLEKIKEISIVVGEDGEPIDSENGYITPLSYDGMQLIWQDEFNGSSLDESDWNYEVNGDGGGNNELQYYRKENTTVSDGFLTIEAKKESYQGKSYTSSRLTTQNKFDFKYGRVDIRALLPKGQGLWPALWMLGSNWSTVGWPKCGETDIMEMVGGGAGRDDTTYGTLHWDNNGNYACTCDQGKEYKLSAGIFADEFHVFTITWDANEIQWFVDDVLFKTTDITPADLSEFHEKFFLIFNVAVGGNWPGSPNSSTVFPQRMIVDYARVFQNQ